MPGITSHNGEAPLRQSSGRQAFPLPSRLQRHEERAMEMFIAGMITAYLPAMIVLAILLVL